MSKWCVRACVLLLMGTLAHFVAAQPPEATTSGGSESVSPLLALQQQVTSTIEKAAPSVVAIQRTQLREGELAGPRIANPLLLTPIERGAAMPYATGAGVVIDARGLILTQYLNVRAGDRHTIVTHDQKSYDATIKGADPRSGLAVLEVDGATLTAIELGDATKLRKGTFVVAVANPSAIVDQGEASASLGVVSNLGLKAPRDANFANAIESARGNLATTLHQFGTLIQTDATLGWSSGGGALVNLDGKLVGVMTDAVTLPGHEAPAHYAIPINDAFRGIIDQLKKGEEIEYALLGVTLADNGTLLADAVNERATVTSIFAGGPAAKAGLMPGDVITAIDKLPIRTAHDLQIQVGLMRPGRTVDVALQRGGQARHAQLTLAKYFVTGEKVVTSGLRSWRGLRVDFATALPLDKLTESADSGLIDPDGCVLVSEVDPDGVAWQSGVRPGMFISHVNDTRVSSPDEFHAAVAESDATIDLRFTERREPAAIDGDPDPFD